MIKPSEIVAVLIINDLFDVITKLFILSVEITVN